MNRPETPDSAERFLQTLEPRYRILRKLGAGAMGEVYLAQDMRLQRLVAIKSIRADRFGNPRIIERIKRESLLHARIGAHPNIVTLFDLVDQEDQLHLILEYVEGNSLEALLFGPGSERPRLSLAESIDILVQCLHGLAHTHRHGIIHRDIKPANVILARDETGRYVPKLMDFGIARLQERDPEAATLTRPGESSPGTPLYMAPEQIDSQTFGGVTTASDLYAMGVLLYVLLAGRPPFAGTLTDVYNGHLNFKPKPIKLEDGRPVPPALMDIVSRAMEKKSVDRFPSAGAFAEALRAVAARREIAEADAVRSSRLEPGSFVPMAASLRSRWGIVGASVGVCILLVAGAILMRGGTVVPPDSDPASGTAGTVAGPRAISKPQLAEVPRQEAAAENVAVNLAIQDTQTLDALETAEVPLDATQVEIDQAVPGLVLELAEDSATLVSEDFDYNNLAWLGAIDLNSMISTAGSSLHGDMPPVAVASSEGVVADVSQDSTEETEGPRIHVVQPGDSLSKIAAKHELDANNLAKWNLLRNPNAIFVGQELYLYERPGLPQVEVNWGSAPRPSPAPSAQPSPAVQPPPPTDSKGGFFQRTKERFQRNTGGNRRD